MQTSLMTKPSAKSGIATQNSFVINSGVTASRSQSTRSLWQTNRGVVALCFVLLELLFFSTDSIGVPAHLYVSGDIGATPYLAVWFMVAFLLPAALIMPLLGSLKARFGAKRIATVGPGLFGLACLAASITRDPLLFIGWRILQGLGAGVIPAAAGGYLGSQLGEKNTPMGKGLVALAVVAGSSMGIPLSALITWHLSWRVLYAGLGLAALVAVAVILRLMPATAGNPNAEIDWLGYSLMSGGFGLLALSLFVGNQREWFGSGVYVVMLWSSVILIALFGWRVVTKPKLIDLRIFQDINFCISAVNLTSVMFFLFMVFGIVPRFWICHNRQHRWQLFLGVFAFRRNGNHRRCHGHARSKSSLIAPTIKAKEETLLCGNFFICVDGLMDGSDQFPTEQRQYHDSDDGGGLLFRFDQLPGDSDVVFHHGSRINDSASSVLFFCTNFSKALSGGVSGAILTATSEGSWNRFREQVHADALP